MQLAEGDCSHSEIGAARSGSVLGPGGATCKLRMRDVTNLEAFSGEAVSRLRRGFIIAVAAGGCSRWLLHAFYSLFLVCALW